MLGNHLLIDLYDCDKDALDDVEQILNALAEIAGLSDVRILRTVTHQFSPHGTTTLNIVSASHFSFHSWPEYNFASVDLFYCSGTFDISAIMAILRNSFRSKKELYLWVQRGIEHSANTPLQEPPLTNAWISFSGTS
jgi:S-adenosylmethionine decarboxylase